MSKLVLVEIGNCNPPLYAVLALEAPFTDEEQAYYIEERQCPSDILGMVVALIWGDDTDPHGLISFVQQIPAEGADWPMVGEVDRERYNRMFSNLPQWKSWRNEELADARNAALEEAAKVAARWERFKWNGIDIDDARDVSAQIAQAIRALASDPLLDRHSPASPTGV